VLRGRVQGSLGDFYGGLNAETRPEPDEAGNLGVYVGVRPGFGGVAMDLSYRRDVEAACCGAVALDVGRPLGRSARVGARLVLDTAGNTAATEARASVEVSPGYTVAGGVGTRFSARSLGENARTGFNLGVSRRLTSQMLMDLRYRHPATEDGGAGMSVEVSF
jgi:hypothetical protein